MGQFTPKLLPRKTLNARVLEQVFDEFNLPQDPVLTSYTLTNCGVHPVTGYKLRSMPEGYRDKRIWEVYTTDPLPFKVEGEGVSPPEIEVKAGVWAVVVNVDEWLYDILSHNKFTVVEKNER